MNKLKTVLLLSLSSFGVFAQEAKVITYKNNAQLELGGHGILYSVNYERFIINKEKFKTAIQLGVAYYPPFTGLRDVWIPVGVNEIISFGKHHIEAGIGTIIIRESTRGVDNQAVDWDWNGFFSGRLGYRYQKTDGKFLWRAGFTPVIESTLFDHATAIPRESLFIAFYPLAALSVGYSF